MITLGLCGKTCSGKTTFFSAATLVNAEISSRTFTTIKPNMGVGFVRNKCPCTEMLKGIYKENDAQSASGCPCKDGIRHVPIKIIDVAGLVPEAHTGKGMGNQFLADMMMADGIIHVVDLSGGTDKNGNICIPGTHNPEEDIKWVEDEIVYWMASLVNKIDKKRIETKNDKLEDAIAKQLSGLGITKEQVIETIGKGLNISSEENILEFCRLLLKKSKQIIVAGNKIDISAAEKIYESLKHNYDIVPCSADSELALRRASEKNIIKYAENTIEIIYASELQKKAFEKISETIKKYGSTGVQKCIERLVFEKMKMIVVYPVENEHKLTDGKGRVLPDAFLMKQGSTALDLAYRVHEDIGKKFIAAVDVKKRVRIGAEHELKDGDVISIKAGR